VTNRYAVTMYEKLISVASYLTGGGVGFVYAIIAFIMKKKLSEFLRYNILQSIFISFLIFVLSMIIGLIFSILSHIPFIQLIVSWIYLIFNRSFIGPYSIIQILVFSLYIYMAVVSFGGKYPRVYMISDIIKRNC
jgi:hypothetical protein